MWFITGCSKGLGKSLVEELIKQGYPVAGTSRSLDNIIKIFPQKALFLPFTMNLKDEEDVKKAINKTIEKFGRIDVVVNNAGLHIYLQLKK